MALRLTRRRSSTAAGIYLSAALGFLASIVAARLLGLEEFGLFAIVVAAVGLLQSLLDLTVEEALTKYGFRYETAAQWGKLRRLFGRTLTLKLAGAALAALALVALAPAADTLFGTSGLAAPLALAALLPLVQAPEGVAATALILRGRYDVRAGLLALSMGLRLAGLAVGATAGVAGAIAGMVVAQALATAAAAAIGLVAFRRFPHAAAEPLGEDAREIRRFVLQSSLATAVLSLRGSLSPLLLAFVAPPAQVGFFRAALAPQQALSTASAPVRMILLTEQTRDWERGHRERVFSGVRRYSAVSALVMAVVLVPLLVFMPDLIVVYGAEFEAAADAARIVLVAAVLQFVFGWTKSFPVTIGRPGLRLTTHGLETVVLVPLTLVLGAAWGATGAAGALLAATGVFVAHWTVLFARVRRERMAPAVAR